jgi:hypothetical protein
MGDREAAIQAAISDIDAGVFLSQRAAAKAYNIPQSTISTRIRGRQSNQASHVYQQRLTPEQEDFLVQWILEEDARAFPPSHARAREMANRILRMNGDHRPVGKHWMAAFLKRNPRVASVVGRKIEAARAEGATPAQIRAFLELFERTRTRLGIRAEDIWNMDETGKALGVCANTRVLASSQKKKAYHQSPENREWASIIECVSATGKKLRCGVIFKGKNLQSTWFPAIIPDWLYTTSNNGWTSNAIGLEWLQRVFLPETAPSDDRWRMLILDGHGSHIDLEFLWTCKQNKVQLLFLPAHSSHVLQPLDLSVFSVVKRFYRNQIQELSHLDDAAPVKKERFITAYYNAREAAITERVVRAGWATAGICPLNIKRVVNSSQVAQRPVTPPRQTQAQTAKSYLSTPRGPRDLFIAQRELHRNESVSRKTHQLIQKAGKAIAVANTRAAQLEAENKRLHSQLEALKPQQPRKKVRVNSNQRFADIETIMVAVQASQLLKAQRDDNAKEKAAENIAVKTAAQTLQSMCTEWQL